MQAGLRERSIQEIMQADRAMSESAGDNGFYSALLQYADNEMVKLEDGQFPVVGRESYVEFTAGQAGPKTISWEPIGAEASQSGDLGYTWGNWKYVTEEMTYYGNYFTAWKKQPGGSWKWTIDGGNTTPAPEE